MALKDLEYIWRVQNQEPQKAVTFEVPNPEHDDYWDEWDEDMMADFFEAAVWARDTLGKDRNPLIGHFLLGVWRLEAHGEPDVLEDLYVTLMEERSERVLHQVE